MKAIRLGLVSAMGVALFAWGHSRGNDPASVARARAQQADNQADSADSAAMKGVREVVEAFVKAYNARDARAIAERFAEDGRTSCRWEASKAFLIRDFELKGGDRGALSGTQRIGWDPTTDQFRSWVFDSEGGFSEGRWTRDGDRWVIKNEGFVPDGRVVTATNIISREGKDRVRWSTADRTLGGEALEDDAEVILVR